MLTRFITLLLWLQFRQRDFIIIIRLKFIKVTVFKLNNKTLILAFIPAFRIIFLVIVSSILASKEIVQKLTINEINDLLESRCLFKSFHFINQNSFWKLNNGALNCSLFFCDGLHLVEKGNLKLVKSILKAIDSNSNANPYKNAVCFNLNEYDFPPLPSSATRSKSPYAPVKYVGPVRKPLRHLFAQVYEPYCSTVLPAYSVRVSISKASIRSFSSKLKTTSSPKASPSSH